MRCALAAAVLAVLPAAHAAEQQYPARPVRVVVPLTAASGADIAGRIVGRQLQDMWKQTVLVDNRPGAGGQIGTSRASRVFEMEVWFGTWAPTATPRPVLRKVADDIRAAMETKEVRDQYAKLGIEPGKLFLGDFAKFVRTEMDKYQQVVKRSDIQPM